MGLCLSLEFLKPACRGAPHVEPYLQLAHLYGGPSAKLALGVLNPGSNPLRFHK